MRPSASRQASSNRPSHTLARHEFRRGGFRLRLASWQFEAALRQQLIPLPDVGGRRWPTPLADQVDRIVAAVGAEHPIGAHRAAARLADRTGLDVERADVAPDPWARVGVATGGRAIT